MVLAPAPRRGAAALVGSVTLGVLHAAPCPVLVVPAPPTDPEL